MTRTSSRQAWRPPACAAACCSAPITAPSNYRSTQDLDAWLKSRGIIAITGVDTRALTALIREKGMPNAVIAHAPDGKFDLDALKREAAAWPGMVGLDLAKEVTCGQSYSWDETEWRWGEGYGRQADAALPCRRHRLWAEAQHPARAGDVGLPADLVPATATAEDIFERKPDGVFLSNGPGDPAATGEYAVPEIKKLVDSGMPVFGICLGHQMLGLALGGKTARCIRAITARTIR